MTKEKIDLKESLEVTKSVNDDYERSKATLYHLLEEGKEAIELAMQITRDTEHPRAIEVLSGLLKNVADINDKLMDLNKKHKEYHEKKSHREADVLPNVTNNTFAFVGTTTELQRLIHQEMKDITPKNGSDS